MTPTHLAGLDDEGVSLFSGTGRGQQALRDW